MTKKNHKIAKITYLGATTDRGRLYFHYERESGQGLMFAYPIGKLVKIGDIIECNATYYDDDDIYQIQYTGPIKVVGSIPRKRRIYWVKESRKNVAKAIEYQISWEQDMKRTAEAGMIDKLPRCKLWSKKYTTDWLKKNNPMDHYYDYSGKNRIVLPDLRTIESFFTPHGIQQIDSWIGNKLRTEENLDVKYWREVILRQPNLHPVIRNNLYSNLMTISKQQQNENTIR